MKARSLQARAFVQKPAGMVKVRNTDPGFILVDFEPNSSIVLKAL
ncbi:hypothetical protein [Daejeonella sp.]|nr:hypothetical protein [Daejeonella sp.]MDO8991773.1 hypothetical protein [Daejeonella sp.]MDP2414117.1 hypothetical protein [Daejeonella sp.]